jgi:hypothetical protein
MNRFTKITATLLMGLALTGCFNGDDDDDDDQDDGAETNQTVQLSTFVSDLFDDDANAEPRAINNVDFDVSSDNENEQAFDDVLN